MKKIEAIIKPFKLDEVKDEILKIKKSKSATDAYKGNK